MFCGIDVLLVRTGVRWSEQVRVSRIGSDEELPIEAEWMGKPNVPLRKTPGFQELRRKYGGAGQSDHVIIDLRRRIQNLHPFVRRKLAAHKLLATTNIARPGGFARIEGR